MKSVVRVADNVYWFHGWYLPEGGNLGDRVPNDIVGLFSAERNLVEARKSGKKFSKISLLPYPVKQVKRVPTEIFTVGFCGKPNEEYRAHKALEALSLLEMPYKLIWLIDEDEQKSANKLLEEFDIRAEFVTGRNPDNWQQIVSKLDVSLHLLFSAFYDPGPYLPTSQMAGVPAVVTDFGAVEFLPEKTVYKTQLGVHETADILSALKQVSGGQDKVGECGKAYAVEMHDARMIEQQLNSVIARI